MEKNSSPRKNLLKNAAKRTLDSGLDACLVAKQEDIYYLTGFYTAGALVVLPAKERPVFLVDNMNRTLTEHMLKGVDIDVLPGALMHGLARCVSGIRIKKLGIETADLSASLYLELAKATRGVKLVPHSSIPSEMRMIKNNDEISKIRKAARETVTIWKEAKRCIEIGMTEKELANVIDIKIKTRSYENSFPTITAFGENTAYPHAVPTDKKLRPNEHAMVDFGIRYNGYSSDLTRIWAEGRINRKILELERAVSTVQDRVIKSLRHGEPISRVVKIAGKFFIDNGLEKYVMHSLGHGVGLAVHEKPFLREVSHERLKSGMVMTVEPGLYIPGVGGVRIEDMVLITRSGCEVLTR